MFSFILVFVVVFVGGASLIYSVLNRRLRTNDADKMKNRLMGTSKPTKASGRPMASLINNTDAGRAKILVTVLERLKMSEKVQELIEQAGVKWTVGRFMQLSVGLFVLAYAGAWVFAPSNYHSLVILPALIAGALPYLYLARTRKARLHKFEELFPDSLEFVSRSMRAGHAFSVALEMIHREFQEPLAGEFRRTFEEHNLGLPLEVALAKFAKRVPSLDVHFFVSAVSLQKRTGGNLAEILDKLAYVIRERFKLRGKIRAISAHGRMTGMALTSIPIAVAVLMFFTNPDYVRFFFNDEIGNYMMGAAVALQILGYVIIQKIVKIEV